MNGKLLALALFVLVVALPTYAANWVFVVTDKKGNTVFIDKSSLQRDGDSVTFWVKINYKERILDDLSLKNQMTINCRRRESITRYMMFYEDIDNRGRLTSSFVPKEDWVPIAPETVHWDVMTVACRR